MNPKLSLKSRYLALAIVVLVGLIALMETRQPFPSFRLATFILAFVALAGMASLLRGKLRDGVVILASLALGLSAVETTATILQAKVPPAAPNTWSVGQSVMGWGAPRAGRFHDEKTDPKSGAPIFRADYTFDSNLLRETHSAETGPTIVFFGDSFTFGQGLDDADTLPQNFADLLGRKQRVLNLGFPGYGPQQVLAELQSGRFDSVIGAQPRLFIFLTAASLHVERTACKPIWVRFGPRYVLENGKPVLTGPCYAGVRLWAREWLENMASYRLFVEPYLQKPTHEDVELYVRILLSAVSLAKEKYGVATLVPYLTNRVYLQGTGFSDDEIIRRLREGGANVVDASLLKEEAGGAIITIKGDGHPTPLANHLRASLLQDYIENRMPGILVAGPHGSNTDG